MTNLAKETIDRIRTLALAFGPSGLEAPVAELILREAEKIPAAVASIDPLGNVVLRVQRGGDNAKKLLITTGMDEQGFMLTERTGSEDRYFRSKALGAADHRALCGRRMLLGNEDKQTLAIFGGKPLHLLDGGERSSVDGGKLFLDLCAATKEEAENAAEIGDFAAFAGDFQQIGENGEYLVCKALEVRCPCALLLETAAYIAALPENTPGYDLDFYFVFAVKLLAGMNGTVSAAAGRIQPDAAVSVGFAGLRTPYTKPEEAGPRMGGGVFLPLLDGSTLYYDSPLRSKAVKLAADEKIPFTEGKGDSSIGTLHHTGGGIPTLRAELPCCNPRTASVIVKQSDYAALSAFLQKIPTLL